MHQSPLEIQTSKKTRVITSLFPNRLRPSSFPAASESSSLPLPLWRPVPWSTQVCQATTADSYQLICPRATWHVNSEGLWELEEKSPERRKKLSLFCLENPLVALLRVPSCAVCEVRYCRSRCSPYRSSTLRRARSLPGSRGSIPSYSASDSSPTAPPRCIALHYIALPARRHCCITVQSSSKMYNWFFHLPNTNWLLPLQSQL